MAQAEFQHEGGQRAMKGQGCQWLINVRRRAFDPKNVLQQLHSSRWSRCDVVDGGGFGDEFCTR